MKAILFGLGLILSTTIWAQGTAEDYERAAGLGRKFGGKTLMTSLRPNWMPDGRMWYRLVLPESRVVYTLVDPASGNQGPMFDHAGLAAAIGGDPERIDIRPLSLEGEILRFIHAGSAKRVNLVTWEVTSDSGAAVERGLRPLPHPAVSGGGGERVELGFQNDSDRTIKLFWVTGENERVPYATLAPGQSFGQNTFEGHVWLITDEADHPLAYYRTPDLPDTVIFRGDEPEPTVPQRESGVRSPDGSKLATVRDHQVEINGQPMTIDGQRGDSYFEWQLWWSPDSRYLLAMRVQEGTRRTVHIVESTPADQFQPKLHSFDYRKPGDDVDHQRPVLIDTESGEVHAIDDALFPNPWSIDDVRWLKDSSEVLFLYNQRGHQVVRLVAVDVQERSPRVVAEDTSPTFIDYANKVWFRVIESTGHVLWMSEGSGWNHIYRINLRTGVIVNAVTTGDWVVRSVESVDEEKGQLTLRLNGLDVDQDPYHVHWARVGFDGEGFTRLTAGDGTHQLQWSPNREYYVATYSRVDAPPIHELRRASDGEMVLELARADTSALEAEGWRSPERFVTKGRDGTTDIWGVVWFPTNYDPSKRYPVIESIYAGPHGHHVPKAFAAFHGQMEMAELGFIVVQIDGMGTNWRSKAFHDVAWKNLADAGFEDRKIWIRELAKLHPSMDLDRVGIYGGSAGGQNAMRALLDHHDLYKVAVADCGCHDNRMDKIWWNELWMGWPIDQSYLDSSNSEHAARLQGKLLLIVGEMDTNVDPASTMQVVHALIKADKDFDLLVIPGAGHGAAGTPYGERRQKDYFVRHLLGVEPRR